MKIGSIQKMILLFQEAFENLNVNVPIGDVEKIAIMIHNAMTLKARSYHTPEHVFEMADPSDPLQTIAALFHDVVYYQVDKGFSPEISKIIEPLIENVQGDQFVIQNIPEDRIYKILLQIFGISPNQKISPSAGLNEFLSAIVMVSCLIDILTDIDLTKLSILIEATIPFRAPDAQGKTHPDIIEERLQKINKDFSLSLSENQLEEVITKAVLFANKDVLSFAEQDTSDFLVNTWKLLPETNAILRSKEIYSIRDYRIAIQKMEVFLCSLNPEIIFRQYKETPSNQDLDNMTNAARNNLLLACQYLQIKLLSIAILEALAELTGGDAPLALFMGEIQKEGEETKRLENYLPDFKPAAQSQTANSNLFNLLESGRSNTAFFDMKDSPLSAFIYSQLSLEEITESLVYAKQMFNNKISPINFIQKTDNYTVSAIAKACAKMVFTRREKILSFVKPFD